MNKFLFYLLFSVFMVSCGTADSDFDGNSPDLESLFVDATDGVDSEAEMDADGDVDLPTTNSLKDASGLPIVFYNVENLFDTKDDIEKNDEDFLPTSAKKWDEEKYATKIENLNKVLGAIGSELPLLIGVAEIENVFVLKDLTEGSALKKGKYDIAHFDSPDRRGIDVGLLYRTDYMKILHSEARGMGKSSWRELLYVQGEMQNGEIMHIILNHWPSRREGVAESEPNRIKAATRLANLVKEIQAKDEKARIVIMGDFNDTPADKSIKNELISECKHLTNLHQKPYEQGKGTITYKGDWFLFDQIIVSKTMMGATYSCHLSSNSGKVFDAEWIMYTNSSGSQPNKTYGGDRYYGGYSDHLPVYVELK